MIFHKIIYFLKVSTFNKSRYKNKFCILNLTRSISINLIIISHIIIEVLLYLNKSFNIIYSKRFTSIHNTLNKRHIFIKLSSTCNTTNPFFKSNIRLSIVYSSILITFHMLICFSNSFIFCKLRIMFHINTSKFMNNRTILRSFVRSSYSILNSNTNKTRTLSNMKTKTIKFILNSLTIKITHLL